MIKEYTAEYILKNDFEVLDTINDDYKKVVIPLESKTAELSFTINFENNNIYSYTYEYIHHNEKVSIPFDFLDNIVTLVVYDRRKKPYLHEAFNNFLKDWDEDKLARVIYSMNALGYVKAS